MPKFVLETPRLRVRRIDSADVEVMHSVYGDPDVVRWVGNGEPFNRALCERWVEITQGDYAKRGYGMFALVERQSGEVIGFGGLVHLYSQTEAEIKYALHRSRWGHGFATEAAAALLAYGADQFGLPKSSPPRRPRMRRRTVCYSGQECSAEPSSETTTARSPNCLFGGLLRWHTVRPNPSLNADVPHTWTAPGRRSAG